jgi:hypothetical protein
MSKDSTRTWFQSTFEEEKAMQKSIVKNNYDATAGEESLAHINYPLDNLAVTWSIGIGIGFGFLVFFFCWITFRGILVYGAYRTGDYSFILTELKTDLFLTAGYFGIGGILRKAGFI